MKDYLGYPKYEKADKPNKRNGYIKKTGHSDSDTLELSTLRDCDSSFEPVFVSKHQTRISRLDDKVTLPDLTHSYSKLKQILCNCNR